jgi:predicted TIM-barrel fold metal-dependent hydrolase
MGVRCPLATQNNKAVDQLNYCERIRLMALNHSQRIVDSHIHWFDTKNPYKNPHAQSYLPDNYRADAEGYNVVGVVHIEAHWDPKDRVGETRWVRSLADSGKENGLLKGIVGEADLSADNLDQLLEGHAQDHSARSIRHIVNYLDGSHSNWWAAQGYQAKPGWVVDQDYLENPKFVANFPRLAHYGLGFDYMGFSNHMKPMAELALRNPGITIYVEHTGMPYDHTPEGVALWREGMRALAGAPNVTCKISGLGNTVPKWTEASIRPYVLEAIDIFGVDRCMFASNFPTDKAFSTMRAIWEAFFSMTKEFTPEERDKLFAANAIRHYRLTI